MGNIKEDLKEEFLNDEEKQRKIYMKNRRNALDQLQSLPLEAKIRYSKNKIKEFYEHFEGDVAVSFSGGKDSTVLLHLVRELYPEVKAVFSDTGLEYPEIREFVKTIDNVDIIKPEKNFKQIIEEYGYPFPSKLISQIIYDYRHTKSNCSVKAFNGGYGKASKFNIAKKWKSLANEDFDVSHKCCDYLKKKPLKLYKKKNRIHFYIGTMTEESGIRRDSWIKSGCNVYTKYKEQSKPLSIWTEQDVLEYIKTRGLPICSIYGDIKQNEKGKYYTTGVKRTGCMYCMFGIAQEKSPNRFEQMKETYPKIYDYCLKDIEKGGLGMKKIFDKYNIKY